jgi:hypothetical protein
MTPEQAQQIAEALLARYNLHAWQALVTPVLRDDTTGAPLYGLCWHALEAIYIAEDQLHDDDETVDTILHEIAHALADTHAAPNEAPHGPTFRRYFRSIRHDYNRAPIHLPQATSDTTRSI